MLIILDRDGVINEDSDDYIKSPEEWIPIPGSLEAVAKLNQAEHTVVIATNQSGLARGYFSESTLHAIHEKMCNMLQKAGGHIDAIFYCPHGPDDQCNCRKPKPGLFYQIAEQFQCDFRDALTIGDSLRDIEAAQSVNCKAALVKTGKGIRTLEKNMLIDIPIYDDLASAVNSLLR